MVDKLEKATLKDILTLKDDFTKHIAYTIFIVILASCITFFILSSLFNKKIALLNGTLTNISHQQKTIEKTTIVVAPPNNEMYVERGSPYDNRTIGSISANVIFHGPRDKKKIALTFDAEMTDGMRTDVLSGRVKTSYNKAIVDTLIQTNTKATLFLTGMWIELYPDVVEQLAANPLFEFGSHSYSDSSYYGYCFGLSQLPTTLRIEDIGATEKLLREHAHIDNRLFRFPGGCYTPEDVQLVNQADDTVVHWDIAGNDGFNTNTNQIIHNVIDNIQNGSIIVLHMNGAPTAPKTAEALPTIITTLKARGFTFVKVNELLGFSPEPHVSTLQ